MRRALHVLMMGLLESFDLSTGYFAFFPNIYTVCRWRSSLLPQTLSLPKNSVIHRMCIRLQAIERLDGLPFASPHHRHVVRVLREVGLCFVQAGTCLSEAACILPNWYSSKEGLTGECPAVFGGAGTALTAAGQAMLKLKYVGTSKAHPEEDYGVTDLFTAACSLDPIGLHNNLDEAAAALEEWILTSQESALKETATALQGVAHDFAVYGDGLDQEAHSDGEGRETSGGHMRQAAKCMTIASGILWQN
jgi:hypothetical protein